jgi:hypothetical protein
MVSAGLTQGIADAAGVSGGATPTADFADRLAYQGIKTASGVAANTTIGGADLGDALKSGGLSLATTMATQVLAKGIGDLAVDLKIDDGDIRKIIAHALAGCAAGQITKNCVAGAIGAGVQEAAGGAIGKLSDDIEQRIMLAGLSAAVATMVVGGDASAVNTANGIAQDAATYNRQLHVKEVQKLRELAPSYAKRQGISELVQALRDVDQTYYETHSGWDKDAQNFLRANASGYITIEGKEVLMFAVGEGNYANPTLLADTWNAFNREAALAYQQTPIKLKSERFETQQKVLEAYLTVVGMLPMGGSIIATLTRYDEAVRNGDTQTQRDIERMLPLELLPMVSSLGKLASGMKVAGKVEKAVEQITPDKLSYIEEPPFNPNGSVGAARTWSTKARIKYVDLPTEGKIRYVPEVDYTPSNPLPRGPNNGYIDRFGNEWTKGPSRTPGQAFEWDVQLSPQGKSQLGWASRDGKHLNVSLDGRITHK